jgi:ATP-dependent Clp protease ATP-binding subunit ClpA
VGIHDHIQIDQASWSYLSRRMNPKQPTLRALERAVEIARQKNTDSISAEQLLFALLKNASGPLKELMTSCEFDRDRLCERLEPLLAVSMGERELVVETTANKGDHEPSLRIATKVV